MHVGAPSNATPTLAIALFACHYLEMVAAMALGMVAFGVLFVSPLDPLGYRATLAMHPYVRELLMLVSMSLPMAAYMPYRGHTWGRTAEMVGGMALPALAIIALTATAAVPGLTEAALTIWSHLAMLLGMLVAMLIRRSEYATSHAAHRAHDHAHMQH